MRCRDRKSIMSWITDVIALIAVATLFGSMAFFSGVIAPLIFVKLDCATAGTVVRSVFPWYYLLIAVCSVTAAGALFASPINATIMGLIAAGAMVSRQILMPRINHNRDRMLNGDPSAENAFTRLHRLSVWINGGQILGAFFVLVRLGMS